GAQLATLFVGAYDPSFGDKWLTMTRAGFFAASGKDTDMVSVVHGLEMTTIDQVHQSLFNPDLVREALLGDPAGEVAAAAKVVNWDKVIAGGPAPKVLLVAPARSSDELVNATARITDQGKGVGRIEWRVNGVTAAVAAKPKGAGPTYSVAKELAL